jgi:hypothetical protein
LGGGVGAFAAAHMLWLDTATGSAMVEQALLRSAGFGKTTAGLRKYLKHLKTL